MAFAQINPKRKEEDYFVSRNKHIEDMLDYDDEDNHYGERMDIIGQNGNLMGYTMKMSRKKKIIQLNHLNHSNNELKRIKKS